MAELETIAESRPTEKVVKEKLSKDATKRYLDSDLGGHLTSRNGHITASQS